MSVQTRTRVSSAINLFRRFLRSCTLETAQQLSTLQILPCSSALFRERGAQAFPTSILSCASPSSSGSSHRNSTKLREECSTVYCQTWYFFSSASHIIHCTLTCEENPACSLITGMSLFIRNLAVQSQPGTVLQNMTNTSEGLIRTKWRSLSTEYKKNIQTRKIDSFLHKFTYTNLPAFASCLVLMNRCSMCGSI